MRKLPRFIAIVSASLASCPVIAQVPRTPPAATLDDTLDITGESLTAKEARLRLSVDVQVDDQGPFRFLVDSGADRTVIGAALARRLALPPDGKVILNSIAGQETVDTVRLDTLTIGTGRIPAISAPALPETFLGAQGIIGIDALAEQRLMLDFEAKRIVIQDNHHLEPALPGEVVVTARRRHGQLILTQTAVGSTKLLAIIDTGSEVTIGNSALLAKITQGRRAPLLQPITITSVTGQTAQASMVVLPRLRIGTIELENVPVAFADVPPFRLFGVEKEPALLLGNDVLRTFRRVSLDFRARRVRFQPRAGFQVFRS